MEKYTQTVSNHQLNTTINSIKFESAHRVLCELACGLVFFCFVFGYCNANAKKVNENPRLCSKVVMISIYMF